MKLRSGDNVAVLQKGGEEEHTFRIAATGKAFEILSSGLYSDKIRAVIRELGTNAADSHIQAGKPNEPFVVHLPNDLEPFFSVTDKGVGLTHEQAVNLYITYFDSDKTDSNEIDGCLGLGSKSPFAYTDAFTVESVYNGELNIYHVYISDRGKPGLKRVSNEATDLPNGVTVKFAVKRQDFNEFAVKASDVYRWFDPHPVVPKITFRPEKWLFQGNGYALYNTNNDGSNPYNSRYGQPESSGKGSLVVMGNVSYPIIDADLSQSSVSLSEVAKTLIKWGVVLWVGRGDCDISASREKLSHTKHTVRFINQRLNEIGQKICEEAAKQLQGCKTLWAARVFVASIMHKSVVGSIASSIAGKSGGFDYKGTPLSGNTIKLIDQCSVYDEATKQNVQRSLPIVAVEQCYYHRARRWTQTNQGRSFNHESVNILPVDADALYLLDDDASNKYARIQYYLDTHVKPKNAAVTRTDYWNNYSNHDAEYSVFLIGKQDYYDLDKFLKDSGLDVVVKKVSEFPIPPRQAANRRGKTTKVLKWQGDSGDIRAEIENTFWSDYDIDWDLGGTYVEVNRFKVNSGKLTNNVLVSPNVLRHQISLLKGCDVVVPEFVGFRQSLVDKAKKHPKWQRLDENILSKIKYVKDIHDQASLYHHIVATDEIYNLKRYIEQLDLAMCFNISTINPKSPFSQVVTKWKELRAVRKDKKVQNARNLLVNFGKAFDLHVEFADKKVEVSSVIDEWQVVLHTYPMLSIVRWIQNYDSDKINTNTGGISIVNYVKVMDAFIKRQNRKIRKSAKVLV